MEDYDKNQDHGDVFGIDFGSANCRLTAMLPLPDHAVIGGLVAQDEVNKCKINFKVNHSYKSCFVAMLEFPRSSEAEDENRSKIHKCSFELSAQAINCATVETATTKNVPPEILIKRKVSKSIEEQRLHRVSIEFNSNMIETICIHPQNHFGLGPDSTAQLNQVRDMLASGRMVMFCRDEEETTSEFQTWYASINHQKTKQDLIQKWFTSTRRFIQLGSCVEKERRPINMNIPNRYSFDHYDEYQAVNVYGTIQEDEHMKRLPESLLHQHASIKLVEIPGAGNRHYMGLLTLTGEQEDRFQVNDTVKLNFDPNRPLIEEAWQATVLEPFPLSQVGEVTMVVSRRKIGDTFEDYDPRVVKTCLS
jgi:hypothetical protein